MNFRVLHFRRLTLVLLCSNTADGHEVTRLGADVNKTIDGFRFSDIWQKNRRFAASEKKNNKWVEKCRKIRVLKSKYVMSCYVFVQGDFLLISFIPIVQIKLCLIKCH